MDKWLGQSSNPSVFCRIKNYHKTFLCHILYLFCVWIVKSKMLKSHLELGHIFSYGQLMLLDFFC